MLAREFDANLGLRVGPRVGRRVTTWLVCGLGLALPTLLGISPAKADTQTDPALIVAAAAGLARNPPVYSDPHAPLALTPPQVRQVQDAIASAQTPIYVAVVPGRAGKALQVSRQLADAIKQPGAYVVVAGESYAATSDLFEVEDLMQEAFLARRNYGTAEVLVKFAQLAGARAHGQEAARPTTPWLGAGIVLAVVVLLAAGYGLHAHRKRS